MREAMSLLAAKFLKKKMIRCIYGFSQEFDLLALVLTAVCIQPCEFGDWNKDVKMYSIVLVLTLIRFSSLSSHPQYTSIQILIYKYPDFNIQVSRF